MDLDSEQITRLMGKAVLALLLLGFGAGLISAVFVALLWRMH